ncbi:flagellar protein [Herbivorax sp. ANBcel31]|uniref:flagellar protein n=1 Tax=Herbivorax sp. ANBcel31 TaxID=3069754 RepID=UPI0027AE3DBB|nr:flagellar protein [Herbivorax sp. ANBcel31]MDQ2085273.1 flagellar protein [Herbivorax sp. ANBcel31]
MFELENCQICGKTYTSNGFHKVCPSCLEHDESEFDKIRLYLNENPCAKIFEVVSALDISLKKIKRYLRECRLEIIESENYFLFCEVCGKSIHSGKYCNLCYSSLNHCGYRSEYRGKPAKPIHFKSS